MILIGADRMAGGRISWEVVAGCIDSGALLDNNLLVGCELTADRFAL